VAGEKVMVLKKTFFHNFRVLLIVRGVGGFLAVVGEIVMFPTMHCKLFNENVLMSMCVEGESVWKGSVPEIIRLVINNSHQYCSGHISKWYFHF
jgi:hypothetical protein